MPCKTRKKRKNVNFLSFSKANFLRNIESSRRRRRVNNLKILNISPFAEQTQLNTLNFPAFHDVDKCLLVSSCCSRLCISNCMNSSWLFVYTSRANRSFFTFLPSICGFIDITACWLSIKVETEGKKRKKALLSSCTRAKSIGYCLVKSNQS